MGDRKKEPVSISNAATLLLHLHGGIFSEKTLLMNAELCQITFKNEAELARALWEWLYFGLYVVVEGIEDNFAHSDNVGTGVAIARKLLSEFDSQLLQTGIDAVELVVMQNQIGDRIKWYESVAVSDGPERVGFAVAGSILGLPRTLGRAPESLNAYQFSIIANKAHIAGLQAINDFFQGCTVSP